MAYKNLDELFDQLEKDMQSIANDEVAKAVTDTFHQENLKIYNLPVTERAMAERRRQRDGYGDKRNILTQVSPRKGNSFIVTSRNITKARGKNRGQYLAPYIEEGYSNGVGGTIPPRPSIKLTIKRLEKEDILYRAVTEGLAKRKWIK